MGLTKNFLPTKTSIKTSGTSSSIRKLLIKSSTNFLEYFLLHIWRQSANRGPCQSNKIENKKQKNKNTFLVCGVD